MYHIIDIEYLVTKGYMQYLIVLKNGNGILLLEDIAKLINKSYSQVTRDIKKIEELRLIETTILQSRKKVVILKRKSYKKLFFLDKRIKNNSTYNNVNLECNFLKAYICSNYDSENHLNIKSYLKGKYFNNTPITFQQRNNSIFKIFNNPNIMFYSYEEGLNVVRVVASYYKVEKGNISKVLRNLERIYALFYTLGLSDINIDLKIITYKPCNTDYVKQNINKYKTSISYYSNNSLNQIIDKNFLGNIDFKSIDF